jgi:threonine dehydrogenase-like Zn-dependent dehydrogenase
VRHGGTVSVSVVHGGEVDPTPMMEMFDRGIQLRMGRAHVKRWIDDLMPTVADSGDPLGVRTFATHHRRTRIERNSGLGNQRFTR